MPLGRPFPLRCTSLRRTRSYLWLSETCLTDFRFAYFLLFSSTGGLRPLLGATLRMSVPCISDNPVVRPCGRVRIWALSALVLALCLLGSFPILPVPSFSQSAVYTTPRGHSRLCSFFRFAEASGAFSGRPSSGSIDYPVLVLHRGIRSSTAWKS